jgi:hypothetical protein
MYCMYIISLFRRAESSLSVTDTICLHFYFSVSRPVMGGIYSFLLFVFVYRVSQEECARIREGVPYVKVYRYNPKHLCSKLNVYGDNGQRKMWSSGESTHSTSQLTVLSMSVLECGVILRKFS